METEFSYSSLIKNSAPIQIVVYYSSLIKHSAPIQIVVFHNIKNKTQTQCINYSPQTKAPHLGTITIIKA